MQKQSHLKILTPKDAYLLQDGGHMGEGERGIHHIQLNPQQTHNPEEKRKLMSIIIVRAPKTEIQNPIHSITAMTDI